MFGLPVKVAMTAVSGCALALSMLTPASASPHQEPVTRAANRAELPNEVKQALQDAGVEGDSFRVTQSPDGGMTAQNSDGWAVGIPTPDSSGPKPLWGVGACAGSFHDPIKIQDHMEWGGENSCGALPPNDVNPHTITTTLRETYNFVQTRDLRTDHGNNSPFSAVATVHPTAPCRTGDEINYSQVVTVVVKGIHYAPIVSEDFPVHCGL